MRGDLKGVKSTERDRELVQKVVGERERHKMTEVAEIVDPSDCPHLCTQSGGHSVRVVLL